MEAQTGNLAKALFQSTLSVRRATGVSALSSPVASISIHALREESDVLALI